MQSRFIWPVQLWVLIWGFQRTPLSRQKVAILQRSPFFQLRKSHAQTACAGLAEMANTWPASRQYGVVAGLPNIAVSGHPTQSYPIHGWIQCVSNSGSALPSSTTALLGQSANGRQLRIGDRQTNDLTCIISIISIHKDSAIQGFM